jgi:CBS domain-containing protein
VDELVADVAERIEEGWDVCVVVNAEGVVAGLLGRSPLRARLQVPVDEAMTLGPRTIRPSARREAIAQRMRDQNVARLVVTHSDGTFVGVVRREDLG